MRLRLLGAGLSKDDLEELSYVSAEMYESTTLLLVKIAAIVLDRELICPVSPLNLILTIRSRSLSITIVIPDEKSPSRRGVEPSF